jgi:hypothetical protein
MGDESSLAPSLISKIEVSGILKIYILGTRKHHCGYDVGRAIA